MGRALYVLLIYSYFLAQGIRRRRDLWSAQSWRRFAALLAIDLAALAGGLRMARAVDEGIYQSMSPMAHELYFIALMTLTLGSALAGAALVMWFAHGSPERQLRWPFESARRTA